MIKRKHIIAAVLAVFPLWFLGCYLVLMVGSQYLCSNVESLHCTVTGNPELPSIVSDAHASAATNARLLANKSILGQGYIPGMGNNSLALTFDSINLTNTGNAVTVPSTSKICLDAACVNFVSRSAGGSVILGGGAIVGDTAGRALGTSSNRYANIFSQGTYASNIASGSNAYQVDNNGARVDFGAGASDYASSDGTTVTFTGPLATSSTLSSSSVVSAPRVIVTATALGTCDVSAEGTMRLDALAGVATGAATRLCLCRSTGASVYTWINVVTGTNGTATTCAP